MTQCPNCDQSYDSSLPTCPNCQTPSPLKSGHCPTCGTQSEIGELFCSSCGASLVPESLPVVRCAGCNGLLKPGAGFCAQCGLPVISKTVLGSLAVPPLSAAQMPQADPVPFLDPAAFSSQQGDPLSEDPLDWPAPKDLENQLAANQPRKEVSFVRADTSELTKEDLEQIQLEGGVTPASQQSIHDDLFASAPLSQTDLLPQLPPTRRSKGFKWVVLALLALLVGGVVFIFSWLLPNIASQKPAAPPAVASVPASVPSSVTPPLPGESAVPGQSGTSSSSQDNIRYMVTETISPQWETVTDFDENGLSRVFRQGNYGVIGLDGEELSPPTYSSIAPFYDQLAVVEKDGKFGYLGIQGALLVPPTYDYASDFSEESGVVSLGGKFGFIDTKGVVTPLIYDGATPYSGDFAAVSSKGNYYYVDTQGVQASPFYQDALPFSGGLAPVKTGERWGYVDQQFAEILPPIYDQAFPFIDDLAIVQQEGKMFYIDSNGEERSPKVDEIWPMSDGISTVLVDDLYGFVDGRSTEFLILPQFQNVYGFSDGVAAVSLNPGIWYYIDKTGKPLFEKSFAFAGSFTGGIARVKIEERFTLIDLTGEPIVANTWEEIGGNSQLIIPFKEGDLWGFIQLVEKQG